MAGEPNKLNETTFILEEHQSGKIKWNNRFTFYHGQWYEQYHIYLVNTEQIHENIFVREYDFSYQQMADMF